MTTFTATLYHHGQPQELLIAADNIGIAMSVAVHEVLGCSNDRVLSVAEKYPPVAVGRK